MKKDKINVKFGNRLRKLRKDSGYYQYPFAFDCGISEAYYGRLERGEFSPTLKMLERISKALGITISDLLKDIEK